MQPAGRVRKRGGCCGIEWERERGWGSGGEVCSGCDDWEGARGLECERERAVCVALQCASTSVEGVDGVAFGGGWECGEWSCGVGGEGSIGREGGRWEGGRSVKYDVFDDRSLEARRLSSNVSSPRKPGADDSFCLFGPLGEPSRAGLVRSVRWCQRGRWNSDLDGACGGN